MEKLNDYLKFLFEGNKLAFLRKIKRKKKVIRKGSKTAILGARG